MKIIFSFATAALLFTSCAGVKIYSDKGLTKKSGIPFYTAKPYLLVERNGAKDSPQKVSVIYLPDIDNKMYARVKGGLGSANLQMVLENSILKSYGLDTDSKVPELITSIGKIPSDLITAAAGMVTAQAKAKPVAVGTEDQAADKSTLIATKEAFKNELERLNNSDALQIAKTDKGRITHKANLIQKMRDVIKTIDNMLTSEVTEETTQALIAQMKECKNGIPALKYPSDDEAKAAANSQFELIGTMITHQIEEIKKPKAAAGAEDKEPVASFELYEILSDGKLKPVVKP